MFDAKHKSQILSRQPQLLAESRSNPRGGESVGGHGMVSYLYNGDQALARDELHSSFTPRYELRGGAGYID